MSNFKQFTAENFRAPITQKSRVVEPQLLQVSTLEREIHNNWVVHI